MTISARDCIARMTYVFRRAWCLLWGCNMGDLYGYCCDRCGAHAYQSGLFIGTGKLDFMLRWWDGLPRIMRCTECHRRFIGDSYARACPDEECQSSCLPF